MNEESIKSGEVTTNEDKIDSTSTVSGDTNENKIDSTIIIDGEANEDKLDSTSVSAVDTNEDKIEEKSTDPIDLSKVKIRHILRERIKKCNLNLKKIIAFILVGAVCFGAGFFTGTASTRHKLGRNFYGKPAIKRNMQGNFNGNKKFKAYPNNGTQAPQQGQSQVPAEGQSGGQSKN